MGSLGQDLRPVLIIAGPTGVGKSSLALAFAAQTGAEIVSADSRQVYRGLDLGTAKPTADEQLAIPHHLVDLLDPGEAYSAGRFLNDARTAIASVNSRGRRTVVVGGSTLYVHALVQGLADLPPLDPDLVEALTREAATPEGQRALFEELRQADPRAAATLDPSKSQRLVRFVGLLREVGRPPSDLWEDGHIPGVPHRLVVLTLPRAELYQRIDQRVERMMAGGLLEEVRRLHQRGPEVRALLDSTIGYRELAAHLDGAIGYPEAVSLIQRNSRRYAKRQLTWYRRYGAATWLDAGTATPGTLLDLLPGTT